MIKSVDDIPRKDLISMLRDSAWFTGGDSRFPKQGYSYDVCEETSFRDVLYRDEPVYPTPEEAMVAHWNRHYSDT